jgi:hypothetical protein
MELQPRGKQEPVALSVENAGDTAGYTGDERDLIRLGKKPVLKVCISFCIFIFN